MYACLAPSVELKENFRSFISNHVLKAKVSDVLFTLIALGSEINNRLV